MSNDGPLNVGTLVNTVRAMTELVNIVRAMTEIVCDLAASDAPMDGEWDYCTLCGEDAEVGSYTNSRYVTARRHKPTCLWRRAVELVSGGRDPDDAEGPEGPLVQGDRG